MAPTHYAQFARESREALDLKSTNPCTLTFKSRHQMVAPQAPTCLLSVGFESSRAGSNGFQVQRNASRGLPAVSRWQGFRITTSAGDAHVHGGSRTGQRARQRRVWTGTSLVCLRIHLSHVFVSASHTFSCACICLCESRVRLSHVRILLPKP